MKKLGGSIELKDIRRSIGNDKETRKGVMAGAKTVVNSLERAVGV